MPDAYGFPDSLTPLSDRFSRPHEFALSPAEVDAKREKLQTPYLEALAAVLVVERETLRQALSKAGMKLVPMEVRNG